MGLVLENQYFEKLSDSLEDNWLYKKALKMPDNFLLEKYSRIKGRNPKINFLSIDSGFRVYVKMYIYSLVVEESNGESNALSEFAKIKEFVEFLIGEQFVFNIKDISENNVESYVEKIRGKISSRFDSKDGINIETGRKKASSIRKFLLNMFNEGVSELAFIQNMQASRIMPPDNPEFYYDSETLEKYYGLKKEKKENRGLSYARLVEILETMPQWNDVELECLVVILANTGLRVSEALNLDVDCCSSATEDEYVAFFENKMDIELVSSDSNSIYWLDNYLASKTKKSTWCQGNPIMIGQRTKDAIDILVAHSANARSSLKGKHGETKIFATFREGIAFVPTPDYFGYRRKRACEKVGIPNFGFHQFRHTFAKMLYDSGIPLAFVKKYLNHIYTDMTAHYTNTSMEDKMRTYVEFAESRQVDSPNLKAKDLHYDLKNAMDSEDFHAMSYENRLELLDMIVENNGFGINIMDHGICLLPNGTPCPNNYLDVNSCIDELCGKFIATEKSIPHINNLIEYRTVAIDELEKLNFFEAVNFNKKKLDQLNNTLKKLEGDFSE